MIISIHFQVVGEREEENTYRPLRKRKILDHGRIRSHFDDIAVPLKRNQINRFGAAALHEHPELAALCRRVATSPFTHDHTAVTREVVELIEHVDQIIRLAVVMHIDHDIGRQWRRQTLLSVGGRDQRDVRVLGTDGIVDLGESVRVGLAATSIVVFVADFHVFDGPGFLAAVPCADLAPCRVGRTKEILAMHVLA